MNTTKQITHSCIFIKVQDQFMLLIWLINPPNKSKDKDLAEIIKCRDDYNNNNNNNVECKNKGDTNNNRVDWDCFKVI